MTLPWERSNPELQKSPLVLAGGPCGGSLPRAWLSGSKGDGAVEGRLHKQSVYDGVGFFLFFFLVSLCE